MEVVQVTTLLDCGIRAMLQSRALPESPELPLGEPGVRLVAINLARAGDELTFDLLVRYALPTTLWGAYRHREWAIVVTLEDTETGQAKGVTLQDPFKRWEDGEAENFLGLPADYDPDEEDPDVDGGYLVVPFRVRLGEDGRQPRLFVRAGLREHGSNALAIDTAALTVQEA